MPMASPGPTPRYNPKPASSRLKQGGDDGGRRERDRLAHPGDGGYDAPGRGPEPLAEVLPVPEDEKQRVVGPRPEDERRQEQLHQRRDLGAQFRRLGDQRAGQGEGQSRREPGSTSGARKERKATASTPG